MSYSSCFTGLVFATKKPFDEVEREFKAFQSQWKERGGHELVLHHENCYDDDSKVTELEVYSGNGVPTDAKLTYGLCQWVSKLMIDKVVRVYVASRSDSAGDSPFFYVITRNGVADVDVDELFKKLRRRTRASIIA